MINDLVFNIKDILTEKVKVIGNGQTILIVIHDNKNYNENTKQMLSAMISAIRYDLEKDCTIVISDQVFQLSALSLQLPKYLLVFGFAPQEIGMQISHSPYYALPFDSFTAIFAEDLDLLANDKIKKTKLWTTLQSVFLK